MKKRKEIENKYFTGGGLKAPRWGGKREVNAQDRRLQQQGSKEKEKRTFKGRVQRLSNILKWEHSVEVEKESEWQVGFMKSTEKREEDTGAKVVKNKDCREDVVQKKSGQWGEQKC